jgi:hypothetical protein
MLQRQQLSHLDLTAAASRRRLLFWLGYNLDKPWDFLHVRALLKATAGMKEWGG